MRFNKKSISIVILLSLVTVIMIKSIILYPKIDQSKNTVLKNEVLNILNHVPVNSLIVVPDYKEEQCFLYYLLEMKYQDDFNIFVTQNLDIAKEIESYFIDNKPIFLHQQRFFINSGLKIFLMNKQVIEKFSNLKGYELKSTSISGLYELLYLTRILQ